MRRVIESRRAESDEKENHMKIEKRNSDMLQQLRDDLFAENLSLDSFKKRSLP